MSEQVVAVDGTIISLYPFLVEEQYKPGLIPASYYILPGDPITDKLGLTHIRSARRRMDLGQDRGGTQYVPVLATELCTSIVHDFLRANLFISESAHPAIFWVPGLLTESDIKSKYKAELAEVKEKQTNWFTVLVNEADEAWSKVKSPRSITKQMRYAAQYLKLEREWISEIEIQKALSVCPLCTAKISPAAIVCPNCNSVLKEKEYADYKKRVGAA